MGLVSADKGTTTSPSVQPTTITTTKTMIPTTTSSAKTMTPATTNSMAADVMLFHTMDDDITFERVRHMPRRTQFVSTHRKLSWQYDRDMKQHERDKRITHVEMSRAKVAMAEKLSRLQDVKKQVERRKSDVGETLPNRRFSAPCLPDFTQTETAKVNPGMTHSQSGTSFPADSSSMSTSYELTKQPASTHLELHNSSDHFDGLPALKDAGKCERRYTVGAPAKKISVQDDLVRRMSDFMDSTTELVASNHSIALRKSAQDNAKNSSKEPQPQSKSESETTSQK